MRALVLAGGTPVQLVLASTSVFRKATLERLQVPFETFAPDIDETPFTNETPDALVRRLSEGKAAVAQDKFPNSLVIGSDQVSVLDGQIIGKPHTHENAIKQLRNASGRQVDFLTGLCVLNTATGQNQVDVVPFGVKFRELADAQIETYLRKDQPYNSAGSFKSEGLGIAMFEQMQGDDPTALIGLPLIRLTTMLQVEGFQIL
ncbi:MAG: Maf family nucleotide pyrophosphatase [Pseudomonadota bacterium]